VVRAIEMQDRDRKKREDAEMLLGWQGRYGNVVAMAEEMWR